MQFRKVCRCMTAWTLSLSMIFGGSFAVMAEDGAALFEEVEFTDADAPAEMEGDGSFTLEETDETLPEEGEEADVFDFSVGIDDTEELFSEVSEGEPLLAEEGLDFLLDDEKYRRIDEEDEIRLYSNETEMSFELNQDVGDAKLDWFVGDYDFEDGLGPIQGESIPEDSGCYTISEDGRSITLNGEKLAEYRFANGNERFFLLQVSVEGLEERPFEYIEVRDPYYDYHIPYWNEEDRTLYPGEPLFINRELTYYVENAEYPLGEECSLELKDVRVVDGDDCVRVIAEEDGWAIEASKDVSGASRVELYWDSPETGEEQTIYSTTETEYWFVVSEDKYILEWEYPYYAMVSNSSMTLKTSLRHETADGKVEYVDDYVLHIEYVDSNVFDVKVNKKNVKVTSKGELTDDTSICAVPWHVNEDGVEEPYAAYPRWVNLAVVDGYLTITPYKLTTSEGKTRNLDIGGKLDLNKEGLKVIGVDATGQDEMPAGQYRLRVEYDPEAWEAKAGTEDDLIPVLTRKASWETSVVVIAEIKLTDEQGQNPVWVEDNRREYRFARLCEKHTWKKTTKAATASAPITCVKRCAVCGIETTTKGTAAPAKVTQVKAARAAYNKIKVTWKKVTNATGYRVYRKTKGGKYTKIAEVKSSKTSYTDSKAVTGTKYYYVVRAVRTKNGLSAVSVSNSTAASATATLDKAASLKVVTNTKHQNTVSWKKVAGATGYQVWCKVGAKGKYKKVKTVTKGTSFVHTKLKKGTKYYYKVRAYRKVSSKPVKNVFGAFTAVKSVTAK